MKDNKKINIVNSAPEVVREYNKEPCAKTLQELLEAILRRKAQWDTEN